MTVDVIIPTQNRPEWTLEAVRSTASPGIDTRVIVVDDGSDPAALERLSVLLSSDERVEIVRLPTPHGAAFARQVGYQASSSPYVAVLDSDDRWLPGKLRRQLDVIGAAEPTSRCSVVLSGFRWFQNETGAVSKSPEPLTIFRARRYTNMSAPLFTRALLDTVGGFLGPEPSQRIKTYEGVEFFLRIFRTCPEIVIDPITGTECREHSGSRNSNLRTTPEGPASLRYLMDAHGDWLRTVDPAYFTELSFRGALRALYSGDYRSAAELGGRVAPAAARGKLLGAADLARSAAAGVRDRHSLRSSTSTLSE